MKSMALIRETEQGYNIAVLCDGKNILTLQTPKYTVHRLISFPDVHITGDDFSLTVNEIEVS